MSTIALVQVEKVQCELTDNVFTNSWIVWLKASGWDVLLCNTERQEFAEMIQTSLMLYFEMGGDITPVLKAGKNVRRVKP